MPRNPPGMKSEEAKVLEEYLKGKPFGENPSIEYNVRLGEGIKVPNTSEEIARMAKMITQMRADAIVRGRDGDIIIEVKIRARADAVGQIMTYRDLYEKANTHAKRPRAIIVCREIHPDAIDTASRNMIEIVIVKG